MSRGCHQKMFALKGVVYFTALLLCLIGVSFSSPLPAGQDSVTEAPDGESTTTANVTDGDSTNSTSDLYVIRAVVYEIGILTDVDNSTSESTERHEEVNLSFINPPHKPDGLLDLSGIPLPGILNTTQASTNQSLEVNPIPIEQKSGENQTSTEKNTNSDAN